MTRLQRALEGLRRYGWVQKRYGYPEVGMCMVGALCYASSLDSQEPLTIDQVVASAEYATLRHSLEHLFPDWCDPYAEACYSVQEFNDDRDRTWAEVEKVFLHAIEEEAWSHPSDPSG